MGYSPRGPKELDRTEQLHFHFHFQGTGGGKGQVLPGPQGGPQSQGLAPGWPGEKGLEVLRLSYQALNCIEVGALRF